MNTTFPTSGETNDENTQKPAPHGRGPRALSPSPWGNDRIRPRHPLPLPTHTVLSALTNLRRRIHANDRGAETLELVIMTPVVLLLIAVIIVGGMVTMAHQKVEHAAAEASRSASLARTISQASTSAKEAATSDLAAKGLDCVNLSISTDTSGFRTRPGVTATVRTTVTCDVSLDSLGLFGISGVRTIQHTSSSPIDTYRERVR